MPSKENLLPYDGVMNYQNQWLNSNESRYLFEKLLEKTSWQSDELIIFGKKHITKRQIAFYADPHITYRYSQISKEPKPWTPALLELKSLVEATSGCKFNSCLLNLYHEGSEGMSWHSDNEKELGALPNIASVSLGAERKFSWKHKVSKERFSMILKAGSLLLMKGEMQKHWLHSLPKSKKIHQPRINLSFRYIHS